VQIKEKRSALLKVKVGVHQGSVLNLLLFTIFINALTILSKKR